MLYFVLVGIFFFGKVINDMLFMIDVLNLYLLIFNFEIVFFEMVCLRVVVGKLL